MYLSSSYNFRFFTFLPKFKLLAFFLNFINISFNVNEEIHGNLKVVEKDTINCLV